MRLMTSPDVLGATLIVLSRILRSTFKSFFTPYATVSALPAVDRAEPSE